MTHTFLVTLAANSDRSDVGYLRARYAVTRDGRRFILRTNEGIELATAILGQAGVAVESITGSSEEEYYSIQGFVSENPDLVAA